MPFIRQKMIYRADLWMNPDTLYVFGDNLVKVGMGGQAKEMRGEPNAIGIPTKAFPDYRSRKCYLDDHVDAHHKAVQAGLDRVLRALEAGKTVVWPTDGIGTGLAHLNTYAPNLAMLIEKTVADFSERFGVKEEQ